VASTAGASVLALGLLLILLYLLVSLKFGAIAGQNPWHSRGFEWMVPSPPPPENWDITPVFHHGPHNYEDAGNVPTGHATVEPTHAS
jgi:cytochrome c oxidase subunit I